MNDNHITITAIASILYELTNSLLYAQVNNNIQEMQNAIAISEYTFANLIRYYESDRLIITYDNEYINEPKKVEIYGSIYYTLGYFREILKGVTALFYNAYESFLRINGVIV